MPNGKVARIDLGAFDGGTEIVSIVETAKSVRFALMVDATGMAPPEWGRVLCDLFRDISMAFARRGVFDEQQGEAPRELSEAEILQVLVDTFTEELASPPVVARNLSKGTD